MTDPRGPFPTGRISSLAHLPGAYFALAPELDEISWSEESRADCANCVMIPPGAGELDDGPWVFHPDARCCTFHPSLANFLVGRALLGDARSAESIRQRVRSGVGVTAWGIRAPAGWRERYQRIGARDFGRDPGMRCPYWVGGDHACAIWQARPATCRTWFCKHEHGYPGAVLLAQLRVVLSRITDLMADHACARAEPPEALGDPGAELPEATIATWLEWYRECARAVDALTPDQLAGLAGDDTLASARAVLAAIAQRPARALPDVLVPAVREVIPRPNGIRVSGYSIYDSVLAPSSLFRFLARLDGTRTWREAQAELLRDHGAGVADSAPIDDATIAELHRVGALESPGEPDPGVLERAPWSGPEHGLERADQETDPSGSRA